MSKIETATRWMENLANDDSHGYDQDDRWGQYGDYDCSSAVISAWQYAGVPVKSNGATYTGNMYSVFINSGFDDVTSKVFLWSGNGLQRGDVLLNHANHVAMYVGNGQIVEASINEFGGIVGGNPGDQTGNEIHIRSYYNYTWDCVLRYANDSGWILDDTGWWYKYDDGSYPTSQWLELDAWYYFDEHGYAVTGWKYINEKWYYFESDCRMQTGWIEVEGVWYFLSKSGALVTEKYIPSATTEHLYYWVNSSGAWTSSSYDVHAYGIYEE